MYNGVLESEEVVGRTLSCVRSAFFIVFFAAKVAVGVFLRLPGHSGSVLGELVVELALFLVSLGR